MDMLGRNVIREKVTTSQYTINLEREELPAGVYTLKISGDMDAVVKLIKKK